MNINLFVFHNFWNRITIKMSYKRFNDPLMKLCNNNKFLSKQMIYKTCTNEIKTLKYRKIVTEPF